MVLVQVIEGYHVVCNFLDALNLSVGVGRVPVGLAGGGTFLDDALALGPYCSLESLALEHSLYLLELAHVLLLYECILTVRLAVHSLNTHLMFVFSLGVPG